MKALKIILVIVGVLLLLFNFFLYYGIYILNPFANMDVNLFESLWHHEWSWYLLVNLPLIVGILCLFISRRIRVNQISN